VIQGSDPDVPLGSTSLEARKGRAVPDGKAITFRANGFAQPRFLFSDERAAFVEDQVLLPMQDSIEMGNNP
jgi:cytochrome c peroxidase